MASLVDLGFSKRVIVEAIVSTYSVDGGVNAAPMGVEAHGPKHVSIRPYISSSTYKNLRLKRYAVINITSDPELYYRTAFKNSSKDGLPPGWFERAEFVDAPRLRRADGFVEVSVKSEKGLDEGRCEVLCEVRYIKAPKKSPTAYCRAVFATIEAIIHATRVEPLMASGRREEVYRLIKLIDYYRGIVERVAPRSRYSEIIRGLMDMMDVEEVRH
ncbi:MAG: DUF447 domain-containing protein [Candidatus Bathyarchaeia archaeon]